MSLDINDFMSFFSLYTVKEYLARWPNIRLMHYDLIELFLFKKGRGGLMQQNTAVNI